MGKVIASNVVTIAINNSTDATKKFPMPPVVLVDVILTTAVPLCSTPAISPPVIAASDQASKGDRWLNCVVVMIEPAINAIGVAIESNRLSIQGI